MNTMNSEIIELSDAELENVNGGDFVTVACIITGVLGLLTWFGGGSGTFSGGSNGQSAQWSFSGTWSQFIAGAFRLFGLS